MERAKHKGLKTQHSRRRPIKGLDWNQRSVLTVPSSQGDQRVTAEGRMCLIILLKLNLTIEAIFLAKNTFQTEFQFIQGRMWSHSISQQVLIISLPNAL